MYKRLLCCAVLLGLTLPLAAQSGPAPKKADVDPNAMAALAKMGDYLRTLKTFEVKSVQTTDDLLDNGQAIQSASVVDVLAARPNQLRVEIKSDEMHRLFFYDGTNFTIYGELVNYYATVPAPPTIGELITKLYDKYDIDLPLVDLFIWGSPETKAEEEKQITSAIDVGPATVDGTTCEQFAFRQDGLDWQIWIQQGDYSLPRKLILTTTDGEARPRHTQVMTWNLAPSFNDAAFTFDPPKDAQKIMMAEVNAPASKENK
jgi:hypothetical protein